MNNKVKSRWALYQKILGLSFILSIPIIIILAICIFIDLPDQIYLSAGCLYFISFIALFEQYTFLLSFGPAELNFESFSRTLIIIIISIIALSRAINDTFDNISTLGVIAILFIYPILFILGPLYVFVFHLNELDNWKIQDREDRFIKNLRK